MGYNITMTKIGERLKDLRLEYNLSLQKLSDNTGIPKSSLSRWEKNQSDISGDSIVILAKYFKVTADYLLGIEDF